MSDYTFSTLAPNEFEALSRDLLERHLGVCLQSFMTGRDGGIDLRHAPVIGQEWVVQCKHYAGSRFSDLKRSVSNEVKKLGRLKTQRYILATSCGLTPANVDCLFRVLSPHCISKHDILGKTDLNGILRANSDIERRHPKLWLTSEAVLSRVLHNDVFVQSDMTRNSIVRRLSLYVYTDRFKDARTKLNSDRVCIISGVPGVGKTTLAEMLIIEHIVDGWELVTIHQNVTEGLRALHSTSECKQIFYYDDFLGQVSSGEKLAKNEDSALLQLLRAVQQTPSKRFILTTREYILAQAKREHEKLARASLDIYQFVIECRDYDEHAKAQILANHLFFNGVPRPHIAAMVRNRGYREIIDHDNYNPRLIESMTTRLEYDRLKPSKYLKAFVSRLDDPSQLWEHIYEEQLSEASRHILLALVAAGTPTPLRVLEEDFKVLFASRSREFGFVQRTNDFPRSLNELDGSFIRIRENEKERVVEWNNPSVLDFLNSWLRRHSRDTEALLKAAVRFQQIEELTNTVPVLVPNDGSPPPSPPDELLVADAIRRTLTKVRWSQLQSILRLSNWFDGGPVRAVALEAAGTLVEILEIEVAECHLVATVIDQMAQCPWMDAALKAKWRERLKSYCLDLDDMQFDQIDTFMPLARWCARNRAYFSDHEFNRVQQISTRIVQTESSSSFWPNTESIWIGMKECVEELERILAQDFSNELETIEREVEDAERPQPSTHQIGERTEMPPASIDSIFEALIQ